jgi:hypothetical protein
MEKKAAKSKKKATKSKKTKKERTNKKKAMTECATERVKKRAKKKEPEPPKTKEPQEQAKEPWEKAKDPPKDAQRNEPAKDAQTCLDAHKHHNMLRDATVDDPVLLSIVAKHNILCGDEETNLSRCCHVIEGLSQSSLAEI